MSGESDTLEAPNWLSELEKKRENRLKARLGHEAGAGAPCITCEEKCPGLDLHFWRKICKNCKCSKEDHDVHDDDIYGWAQFQLLGSKPNKIKKKIVLPGKKDEVELDWTPKGNTETIDRYLKTLDPEALPVKGSQAAQDRKQLLQKQIPIHDIDPTLCHELTESELAKMQEYIKHMKGSAGVGQIVQFGGLNYGNLHSFGEANAKILASRYPKGVPSIETVKLQGERKLSTLTMQLDKMGLHAEPKYPENINAYDSQKLGYGASINYVEGQDLQNPGFNYAGSLGKTGIQNEFNKNLPGVDPTNEGKMFGYGTPSSYADVEYLGNPGVNYAGSLGRTGTRNEFNKNSPGVGPTNNEAQMFGYATPINYADVEYLANPEPNYHTALGKPHGKMPINQNWGPGAPPGAPPVNYEFNKNLTEPSETEKLGYGIPVVPGKPPNYQNWGPEGPPINYEPNKNFAGTEKLGYGKPVVPSKPPNYQNWGPGSPTNYELNKNLPERGNSENLHYGNHPNANYATGLGGVPSNKNLGNYAREQFLNSQGNPKYPSETNLNMNLPHYAPATISVQSDQQNPASIGNLRDLAFSTHHPNMDAANSNYRQLQSLNPSQIQVPEDELVPNKINIGAIRDVTYGNPEIKSALQAENKIFDEYAIAPREKIPTQSQQCKKCSKLFKPDEFAIFVEKSNSLYHSDCFKCAGCNQNLADLFYFYDKEMDDVYCGRDFAKIRGIPRCKACDELIFVKEYCLAENSTFHLKHFCCFECDEALAGKNYLVEDSQPVCVPCFEKLKANKCMKCLKVIRPDEEGVSLTDKVHFHTYDECFCCSVCRKPLKGAKLLFRNSKLYCSSDCFKSDQ